MLTRRNMHIDPPPAKGAGFLAFIGVAISLLPIVVVLIGFGSSEVQSMRPGLGRLAPIAWGAVAALPCGIIALLIGTLCMRDGSRFGLLAVLLGSLGALVGGFVFVGPLFQ